MDKIKEYTNIRQLHEDRKNIEDGETIKFRGEKLIYTPNLVSYLLATRDDSKLGIEEILKEVRRNV